ncbi:uncharacterized protein BDR25DRAFT_74307 [Lindgomyces ingoldianus]|uniref:Uncharacterized protein n=1 Tax=Lindgomyces ingoldianus TaxID=673940 RepID=A0ACB6QK79_9PLEO|nr:uncharacterized protein BDR25DRAFT_74307 [Lindgomyces ingoldianus]KAF2466722.1 hypothetical protein BDR25DRAFT_74307 [Lindgomyces ingoldianus]
MTPRSPKQQPKTSTISRRLRTRTDQSLSIQPPELPQLRNIRSRRAATLPSARRISVTYQPEQTHTPVWDPSEILEPLPRCNTSHPTGFEENPPPGLLLSQPLDLPPYHSPQRSPTDFVPISTQSEPEQFELPHSSGSDLLPSPLPSLSGSHPAGEYEFHLSPDPDHPQDPSVELQDMSILGFQMPAQYGSLDHHYGSPPTLDSPSYPSMNQQTYPEPRSSQPPPQSSGTYVPSYTSSPSLQNHRHSSRPGEQTVLPPYQPSVPRSPYQPPLGSMRASPTPISYPPSSEPSPMLSSAPHSYPYPAIHTSLPGQNIGTMASTSSSYPPPPIYPPSSYDPYNSLPTTMYPPSTSAAPYSSYDPPAGLAPHHSTTVPGLSSSPGSQNSSVMPPRIVGARPKPQCWEHGCNGRQFSTFSNLLRHQREKSGTAAKSYCPRCGAEFTRTTARNGHMAHEKCKPRRTSDTSR